MKRIIKYLKCRKGIALILLALMLVVLLMLAALAIDFAYMYYVKNQLQVAADASSLAGAAELDGTNSTDQEDARERAWEFACKNTAGGSSVYLVIGNNNQPCNQTPEYTELNLANSDTQNDDIVVGNWDGTDFRATRIPVNAVRVRARRTAGSPGGPVGVFFGRILDWSFMNVSASAIAARKPLAVPGIPLCLPSCNFTVFPKTLILQKDTKSIPIEEGMAWTAFDGKQAPNIGKGGDVVDYIWSRKEPPPLCDLCITTNNGVGVAIQELKDAFESTTHYKQDKDFDSNGNVIRWKVAVPILARSCDNPCPNPKLCPEPPDPTNPLCDPAYCACPPGGQGNNAERYHVEQIAELHITSVINKTNEKGITVDYINCIGCPTSIPLGRKVALVK